MTTKLRVGTLGTCPVCGGSFKVRTGVMVHHGFERPGDGVIHGDCFAVGMDPYETSPKGCEAYRASCASSVVGLETFLAEIPSRTSWTDLVPSYVRGRAFDLVHLAIGVTPRDVWARFVAAKLASTAHQIQALRFDIARMDRLIVAWSLRPLREVTEEIVEAEIAAARARREADRAARAAVKAEKAATLKAKRDAREAVREVAFQAFIDELTAIAGLTEKREQQAFQAWLRFFSKKTARRIGCLTPCYYSLRQRGLEPLLIELGLAWQQKKDGYVVYRYGIG